MKFDSLAQWLAWQETLNPAEIELGLERINHVRELAQIPDHFDCPLIIVGGTNGKGSVMAMLETMARVAGYRVCAYTSPHIARYNERIRIAGEEVDDASLCAAFERIDQARGEAALTYFEFGTLAALDLFTRAAPDLVLLEVGLGGRLDAVNIMQPDVSVITTVDIDHVDWLGKDREAIGFEKAGIMRSGKPVVCGDRAPPQSLLQQAANIAAKLLVQGRDFSAQAGTKSWQFSTGTTALHDLPVPALRGEFQLDNAAAAIMALELLKPRLLLLRENYVSALQSVTLAGRYESLRAAPQVVVDVAHNTQAVAALCRQLQAQPCAGKTRLVIAMLADKPVAEVIALLAPRVDVWYSAGLENVGRGLAAAVMSNFIQNTLATPGDAKLCASKTVAQACAAAMRDAGANDRIIVLGSFYTVAAAKQFFAETMNPTDAGDTEIDG